MWPFIPSAAVPPRAPHPVIRPCRSALTSAHLCVCLAGAQPALFVKTYSSAAPSCSAPVCLFQGAATLPSASPIFPASRVTPSRLPAPAVHGVLLPMSSPRVPVSPCSGHGRHAALPGMFPFWLSLLYGSVPSPCLLSVPCVSARLKSGQEVWEGLACVWGWAGQMERNVFTEWPLVLECHDNSSRILVVLQFSCLLVFTVHVDSCFLLSKVTRGGFGWVRVTVCGF